MNALEEANEEAVQYKKEIEKLKMNLSEKMNDNVKLRSNINELRTECEKARQVISNFELRADKDASNIKKLSTKLNQVQDEKNKLVNRGRVLEQELNDKEMYIEQLQINCERFCNENSQLKKVQDDTVKENIGLLEINRNLKSQFNESQGIAQQLNDEVKLLKSNLDSVCLDHEEQIKLNDEIRKQLNKALKDIKKIMNEHEIECEQLKTQLQSTMEEKESLRLEIIRMQRDNTNLKVIFKL